MNADWARTQTWTLGHKFSLYHVSSLLSEQKQHEMRTFPDTSTHDQRWELNPWPFDLSRTEYKVWSSLYLATTTFPRIGSPLVQAHLYKEKTEHTPYKIWMQTEPEHKLGHSDTNFRSTMYHRCWVNRSSMKWELSLTLLHMTSSGNWIPDLLISNPMHCPLSHMLPWVLWKHTTLPYCGYVLSFFCSLLHWHSCSVHPLSFHDPSFLLQSSYLSSCPAHKSTMT